MISRVARLFGCSAVWALCACGDKSTEVELRLFPCTGAPTSVSLTIQSYGAGGEKLGEPLAKTFPIDDQRVFDDGFATVGFTPPAGTLHADIIVVWGSSEGEIQARYNESVPGVGAAMELFSDKCEDGSGTTTMMSTTLDPTTDSTSGPTTDAETTGTSSTGTESTSTSTSTSTSEATTDSSTTTTTTTSDTSTSEAMTTGMTGDEPMVGGDCEPNGEVVCTAGAGELGIVLQCLESKWQHFEDFCGAGSCSDTFEAPQAVGCTGGVAWGCACAETPRGECPMGMQSQCGDNQRVELCIEEDGKTWYYEAVCQGCAMIDGQPSCL